MTSPSDAQAPSSRRPVWRWAGYGALALVMGLGFWGYLSPSMRLNWESVAALCGF